MRGQTGTTSDVIERPERASPASGRSQVGRWPASMAALGGVPLAIVAAAATAYLGITGLWFAPLGIIVAIPLAILLHRYPLAGVTVWLFLMPFLVDNVGGGLRRVYWLVHRVLPFLVLGVIIVSSRIGHRRRRLPRLSWPELAMAAYVVLSVLSVLYLSQVDRAFYDLYDFTLVPMALYLIIRLEEPDEHDLRRFMPVLAFLFVTQVILGWMGWLAPQVLPAEWLDRAGTRTTGSLRAVPVYGATMVFAAAILLHIGWNTQRRFRRALLLMGALMGGVMVFMTFSRASWLAGLFGLAAATLVFRGLLRRIVLFAVPILAVTVALTGAGGFLGFAGQRFSSDSSAESALSRVPVAIAAFNMFEERPLWGFGYGNFDEFDRQYQEAIPGLVVPRNDHASHNTYLTILAEQGLSGLLTFLAPMLWWLILAVPTARRLPRDGIWSRQLLVVLWIGALGFFIVSNFSNVRNAFGLGMWWMTLALIGVITTTARREDVARRRQQGAEAAARRVTAQIPGRATLRSIAARREDRTP